MNFKLIVAILIFLLVLGGVFFVRLEQDEFEDAWDDDDESDIVTAPGARNRTNQTLPSTGTFVSVTQLATHNTASDCWIAYKGKVYDMTSYLSRHPGGSNAINRFCGSADAFEQAFTNKHGTSKASLLVKVATFMGDFDVKGSIGN